MIRRRKVRVTDAAARMGVTPMFLRIGLRLGKFPFGTAVQGPGGRYADWDVALPWRPWDALSITAGRRWRVGPPPDYGGAWTYVQVWWGM